MSVITLPAWMPDQPDHNNQGLITCLNVIPRTDKSYAPFRDLSVYSSALSARCQGAYATRDSGGNIIIFAGDATMLQKLAAGSTSFSDVTRASGGAYSTGVDDSWRFATFGDRVIATNFADDIQSYQFGVSTKFAQLSASAPKGKYLAIWNNFLVIGHLQGFPQRVRWSAIDDATSYPTIGSSAAASVQSDLQDLVGDGGDIQGIVGGLGNADGAVWQERALFRTMYIGPDAIFKFDQIEGARGTGAPGSIVQLGAVVFYLGEDGFYVFDGAASTPIGAETMDKTFFKDVSQTYISRMSAAVDPINKIVYWAYAGAGNQNGTPNRILAFNWSVKRWALINVDTEIVFRAGTFGYDLDSASSTGYDVDSSPFGPDSRFWVGGKPILGGFTTAHKLGFFSGATLGAVVETGDLDMANGQRVFVSGIRPIVDNAAVLCSVGYRDKQSDVVAYTQATTQEADEFCAQRVSARYARAKIEIPAGEEWEHLSGFEPRVEPDGER